MFKKAERKKVKLKLAVTGPSGSGKTYSSLLIAKGMGGKIAVIDTENESASLYADVQGMPEYDVLEVHPPYTVDKYRRAVQLAIQGGYQILIVDSISHAWAGEGGILDRKARMDSLPGSNSYTNWNKLTPEQEILKSVILSSDIHMICTMRSKQDYALQTNDKGKMTIQKMGMAPIQREGMEYEFTTVFDMDIGHNASCSKDRTHLFDGRIFTPDEQTGKELMAWLVSGKDNPPPQNSQQANQSINPDKSTLTPQQPKNNSMPAQKCGAQAKVSPRPNPSGGAKTNEHLVSTQHNISASSASAGQNVLAATKPDQEAEFAKFENQPLPPAQLDEPQTPLPESKAKQQMTTAHYDELLEFAGSNHWNKSDVTSLMRNKFKTIIYGKLSIENMLDMIDHIGKNTPPRVSQDNKKHWQDGPNP